MRKLGRKNQKKQQLEILDMDKGVIEAQDWWDSLRKKNCL